MTEGKLPAQLKWRDFLCVLKQLEYEPMKSKHGSARSFQNPNREPEIVTFHEPHGGDTLRAGTLREYLRKLRLDKDEFLARLKNC